MKVVPSEAFPALAGDLDYLVDVLAVQDETKGLLWTWLPDLYSVSTIDVRSDVSWIRHVDSFPLLLREVFLIPGK